jgi:hypothetical protein
VVASGLSGIGHALNSHGPRQGRGNERLMTLRPLPGSFCRSCFGPGIASIEHLGMLGKLVMLEVLGMTPDSGGQECR